MPKVSTFGRALFWSLVEHISEGWALLGEHFHEGKAFFGEHFDGGWTLLGELFYGGWTLLVEHFSEGWALSTFCEQFLGGKVLKVHSGIREEGTFREQDNIQRGVSTFGRALSWGVSTFRRALWWGVSTFRRAFLWRVNTFGWALFWGVSTEHFLRAVFRKGDFRGTQWK